MGETAAAYLGGERIAEGRWSFELGEHLYGAFGGAFGGAVSAAAVIASRPLAATAVPTGIGCHFLRGTKAGTATVDATVVHSGRALSVVTAALHGPDGRLAASATVTFADRHALASIEPAERTGGWADPGDRPGGARPFTLPPDHAVPIVATLQPWVARSGKGGFATGLTVPFDMAGAEAEAACFVADFCLGPPVAAGLGGTWHPHPNPDISLRFAPVEPATSELVGVGRLASIAGGVALVEIEVLAGRKLVATGISTALVMGG